MAAKPGSSSHGPRRRPTSRSPSSNVLAPCHALSRYLDAGSSSAPSDGSSRTAASSATSSSASMSPKPSSASPPQQPCSGASNDAPSLLKHTLRCRPRGCASSRGEHRSVAMAPVSILPFGGRLKAKMRPLRSFTCQRSDPECAVRSVGYRPVPKRPKSALARETFLSPLQDILNKAKQKCGTDLMVIL